MDNELYQALEDARTILEDLTTARIYAGAMFEKMCKNKQYVDACIFQSIRDSLKQNMDLLRSYITCKEESEGRND